MDASKILTDAAAIVGGSRQQSHGQKERSFAVVAALWEGYLTGRKAGRQAPISPRDTAMMMVLLKVARSCQGDPVTDHFLDMAGYSAIAGELAAMEVPEPASEGAEAHHLATRDTWDDAPSGWAGRDA
ncbi:DUF6378 domain-containing protein [Roseomonas mucosa]|uniref:DUF6378 domain-containing protein n=1 Tax=Roseomonas mucosa TaxID=207340 RepID=UPI0030CC253B